MPRAELEQLIHDLVLAAGHVPRAELALERDLMTTKWFDYRFMSPVEATRQFARAYVDAAKHYTRANFDRDRGERMKALPAGDLFAKASTGTSLWRARQYADALGVPYGLYIDEVMRMHMDGGGVRVPYPNQLYASRWLGEIGTKVADAWAQRCRDRFTTSELEHYRRGNQLGFPSQRGHHAWVLEQLQRGAACRIWLALERGLLTVNEAIEEFGVGRVETALARLGGEPDPMERTLPGSAFIPSCLGVPGTLAETEPCVGCPAKRACARVAELVEEQIVARKGSLDPVLARKRAQTRDRVRRLRAKKRAAALAS
jgi:hypothetical protein